jgi:putative aminopeptidase FrvX
MDQEKIREAVRTTARDNRLSCAAAHELARTLNITPEEIGAICNQLKIKITACRLGCF